ncbi:MAG: hypothetical protein JO316_03935 [Abitibacteriaceae bacterium]|nr:hypothetical protein [Abditibacteriaceae bacterium]
MNERLHNINDKNVGCDGYAARMVKPVRVQIYREQCREKPSFLLSLTD